MRLVRGRDWPLILITIAAPICAVIFLLPPKQATRADLDDPPFFRLVEVKVDRIEPLPWTFHNQHNTLTTRFALGWIGERALLLRCDPELPSGPLLRGMMQGLHGEEETWVHKSPNVAAVVFPAELDVTDPVQRVLLGLGGVVFSLVMFGIWIWRIRKWSAPERAGAIDGRVPSDLGVPRSRLDVPAPRGDELAAAMARKHVPLYALALYFVLYGMLVMAIPGLVVAMVLEPQLWVLASTLRQIELFVAGFVIAAPLTSLPFLWWARRRRGEIARLVRDGAIHDAAVLSAVVEGPNTLLPYTVIVVAGLIDGSVRRFRCRVRGIARWVGPDAKVRVLTAPRSRPSIVIAPTSDDFLARRA